MTPRTVIVTGASAGFGTSLVHRYAGAGWKVVAAARRTDRPAGFAIHRDDAGA